MEHEVLFRDIAAAELKVRCNLEVEALGELFIQCSCVIGTLFCVPTHPRLSPSRYVQQVTLISYCKNRIYTGRAGIDNQQTLRRFCSYMQRPGSFSCWKLNKH